MCRNNKYFVGGNEQCSRVSSVHVHRVSLPDPYAEWTANDVEYPPLQVLACTSILITLPKQHRTVFFSRRVLIWSVLHPRTLEQQGVTAT